MGRGVGTALIWVGVGLVVVGLIARAGRTVVVRRTCPATSASSRTRRGFFVPITSMLVVSVVATLLVNLVQRLR